jgi:hypothetical protein
MSGSNSLEKTNCWAAGGEENETGIGRQNESLPGVFMDNGI